MNVGEIVTRVQRQFGDDSGAQITRDDIVRWINDAQMDINRKTEILQEHREADILAGDKTYDLPSNFMAMVRVTLNDQRLVQMQLRDLDLRSSGADLVASGTPTNYYVWNRILYLYPGPAAAGAGNIDIWYVRTPTAVANDNDTPDLPVQMHEDIVRFCLGRAKELDSDDSAAQLAMGDYESRMMQARHEQTTQPLDSYPAVRALPGDDGGW